ncbi:MAG: ABC transporter substrate-binding protein, partial [Paraglaciecola chathamensis]
MWQTSKHANIRSRIGFFSSFSWANLALLFAVLLSVLSVSPVALGNSTLKETITELEASQQWQQTLKEARGQTVYFYAWGGSKPVNDYLRWAAREIASRYKVRLRHVKVADISEAVSRLKAEDGSKSAIDLLWINGENFSYLKAQKLLLGKLPSAIPNTTLLATEQLSLHNDFGVPMEGYEVPWGVGQFNLIANQSLFSAKDPEQTSITPADIFSAAER